MDIHESYLIFIKIFLFPFWMTYVKKKNKILQEKKTKKKKKDSRNLKN